jgi:CRISPR locus-related DNA-binding protein
VELIDKNKVPGTKIIVSVGGGSRSLANAALLGCYARRDRVFKIVSNGIMDNEVISLPKLSYDIGSTKRDLLAKMQDRRDRTILQIAKEMRRTRGMIYQHLKELKDHGYLDDDYNITDAGKLALL